VARACTRRYEGGPGIDESPPDIDAGHALFELAPRLTRLENAVLRSVDPPLTFRQYRLLERVADGYTTVTALGRLATITLPAISESVDVLVRKGLLERRANEQDRRESNLHLTAPGTRALEQANALLAETAQRILNGVPGRRRPTLARDTRQVIEQVTASLLALREADRNQEA
jgi:DNA-binding MarR family transcriptional regulator